MLRDDELVARVNYNQKLPVDPGNRAISARAPGKKPWKQVVRADASATATVNVPALEPEGGGAAAPPVPAPPVAVPNAPVSQPPAAAAPAPPTTAPATAPATATGNGQRIAAVVVGVVGLAGIGLGTGLGLSAKSTWNDALTHCAGGAHDRCDAQGTSLGTDARGKATISTIGFGVGVVGLVGAAVLYATAPRASKPRDARLRFVPDLSRDRAAALFEGDF